MTISDTVTPEDLEQNLADANHPEGIVNPSRPEDAYMEDGRMAATSRVAGIDMGRAVIMDREVSNTETIVRVKLDNNNPYSQERQTSNPSSDGAIYNQDRRISSAHGIDNSRSSYRPLERRNSSPSRIDTMRASYVGTDSSRLDSAQTSYIHMDPSRPDSVRTNHGHSEPPMHDAMAATRTSFVNMDPQRVDYNRTLYVNSDAPQVDPNKTTYVHSGPSMVDYPEPAYCPAYRRGSSPPYGESSGQPPGNLRRASSPGVDNARPSLSVFRFKQTAANAGNSTPSLPPLSPSPRRRNTSIDTSSVMKPTFNSARRSTYHAHFGAEKRRSESPTRTQSPERRTSTGDVTSSTIPPMYHTRRRTTTGDVNLGKRPGSPVRGRESKRFSRAPYQGPFGAVVLSWTNLTVRSREGKILLDNLSGQVHTGFTAIMGPSGSGKSTLLNTLGCRMDKSATVSGQIRLNGLEYTIADLKQISGYVMQDDLLNPHLTVDETLWYTVKLKLEPTFTEAQLAQKVDTVIQQMGLEHCRGTVIGSALRKGISGGERKRVAVGMELLTSPQLLFLDEPTSGLDSMTALSICTLLRDIAVERYCTVVCTIHQPQSRIFNLFQFLIILKGGKLIYQGSAPGVLKFFEESGFPCPERTNPADHLLDVLSHTDRYFLQSNEEKLRSNFIAHPVNLDEGADRPLQLNRERMPWHRQFMVLLNRGYKEQYRKKNVVITQLIQSIVTALLIGGVFFQIGHFQKSTTRRQPVLFFCVINQGVFGALTVINSFPSERVLILRERAAGMYYSSAYYMAKITAESTCQVISPIMFSMVVYWMVGFQHQARKFFLFTFFMILCQLAATSLALMTSALCRTTDLSVTVLPMLLEVNRLFGGFFLPPINLPHYFAWLDALSYVKYCYVAISQNELRGLTLDCLPHEIVNGVCPITSGEKTMRNLGLDYITIGDCAGILVVYIVVTRFVAYLGIRFIKH